MCFAAERVSDFARTRIEPGANPREEWDEGVYFHNPSIDAAVFERRGPDGALFMTRGPDYDERRYVPHDVCRWRSTNHRDELARRARAYATERVTYSRPVR